MLRHLALVTSISLLVFGCRGSSSSGPERPQYRCDNCNVLLISVDTLRADHLSLYGYERPTTPFLERLARDAAVFENMISAGGGTLPSHISMMTSLPVGVHRVTPAADRGLEAERVTLAEQLAESGFRTAAFTDAGWLRGRFGFAQGFELFDDSGGSFATILPKARAWLEETSRERFFLFLHTYDVHSESRDQPYDCPGEFPDLYTGGIDSDFDGCVGKRCASQLLQWLNRQILSGKEGFQLEDYIDEEDLRLIEARYDGCINYVDQELRSFIAWLQDRDLYENTLLVITSDHGEEFLDHGRLLHRGNSQFEELIRIPLIIKFPSSSFAGMRVQHLSSMIDLMPTLLDVVGVEPNPQVMGLSLVPTLSRSEPVRDSAYVFSSIRTERWKFMRKKDGDRLYDLQEDPDELHDLLHLHPDLVERFEAESERAKAENRRQRQVFEATNPKKEKLDLSPEEIEELQALGYLE